MQKLIFKQSGEGRWENSCFTLRNKLVTVSSRTGLLPVLSSCLYRPSSSSCVGFGTLEIEELVAGTSAVLPSSTLSCMTFLHACEGVEKYILETGTYSTFCILGGSHQHNREVHEVFFCIFVFASRTNSNAAIWEQASPKPAMHVQWAQIIVPPFSAATHCLTGVVDIR